MDADGTVLYVGKAKDLKRRVASYFGRALNRRLQVMDLTAVTLCAEGNLSVTVFDISDPENLLRILQGEPLGTRITKEPPR